MSWANVAGAAVGVIGGAILNSDASDAQTRAANASASAADRQAAIAEQQMQISQEQWDLFKKETLPLIQEAAKNIAPAGGVDAAISREVGDVRSQYAQAGDRTQRQLDLTGRNPSDPIQSQLANELAGGEAKAISEAIKSGRQRYDDQLWNRRMQAIALYQNPAGAAAAGAANAATSLRGAGATAQGDAANAIRMMALNNEQIGQLGYGAGNLFRNYMRNQGPSQTVPGAYPQPTGGWDSPEIGGMAPQTVDYPATGYAGYGAAPYADGGKITRAIPLRRGYAEGGEIQGPGTGTSDSISAIKKPGTFVLSADTVQKVGTNKLRQLMEKAGVRPGEGESNDGDGVRVQLSNGEWAMPPAVTRFHGEEFFNKMQQKYHRPIMDEFGAPGGAANGGAVTERALPRTVEDAILATLPTYGRR